MKCKLSACLFQVVFLSACVTSAAHASIETVVVTKILNDNDRAIIVRKNSESYLIYKGFGCPSLWRYEGKEILVNSPGSFLGDGSTMRLPDETQECQIIGSERIDTYAFTGPYASTGRAYCDQGHRISQVISGGQIIQLDDDTKWQVDSKFMAKMKRWLPAQQVTICGDIMINKVNDERARVRRIQEEQQRWGNTTR